MKGSIAVSPKHGLNPSLDLCYFCQEPRGVLLVGLLPHDAQAPHSMTTDAEPCDKCRDYMAKGIIMISIRDGEPDRQVPGEFPNPYRTGAWAVVTDDGVRRIVSEGPALDRILSARFALVEDEAWDRAGLPRVASP